MRKCSEDPNYHTNFHYSVSGKQKRRFEKELSLKTPRIEGILKGEARGLGETIANMCQTCLDPFVLYSEILPKLFLPLSALALSVFLLRFYFHVFQITFSFICCDRILRWSLRFTPPVVSTLYNLLPLNVSGTYNDCYTIWER